MADYYTEYSFTVPFPNHLRPLAEALCELHQDIIDYYGWERSKGESSFKEYLLGHGEDVSLISDEMFAEIESIMIGVLSRQDDFTGFGDDFEVQDRTEVRDDQFNLWFSSTAGGGNVEEATALIQELFDRCGPEFRCAIISLAYTCTKPRTNAFGGAAVLVTKDAVEYFDPEKIAMQRMRILVKASSECDIHPDHLV